MTDLPKGWVEVALDEAIDFQEGPGIMARDFRESGVPLVRLSGLGKPGSVLEGCNYLDPEMVAKRWSHFSLRSGDTLLSTSASLGRVARVDADAAGAIPYTGIIRMRPSGDRVRGDFIKYLLASPHFQRQAEAMGAGSVMRHFGPSHLRAMTVVIPPNSEQQAITEVLGALDDKIESNRRVIATSEAILDAEADLLDGKRVPMGELVSVSRETVDPSSMGDSKVDLFSIPAFDAGRRPERIDAAAIKSGKSRVDGEAVLLSRLNPRFPRLWHAVADPVVPALCSTEFMVLRPRDGRTLADVWLACAQPEFRDEMIQRASGTSGSHQRVRPNDVLAIEVVDTSLLGNDVHTEVGELLQLVEATRRESSRLAALRDALLPELLSGRLRVPEVAEAVT